MKKKNLFAIILIFPCLIVMAFSSCNSGKRFRDIVGEWGCDEIYFASRGYDGETRRGYSCTAGKLRIDGKEYDLFITSSPSRRGNVVDFHDLSQYKREKGNDGYYAVYPGQLIWGITLYEQTDGSLKIKVYTDELFNGRFKGKTFYLRKISDYPEDDSLFKLPDTDARQE